MTWSWPKVGLVVDCNDLEEMAGFWAAVLGFERRESAGAYVVLESPDGREPRVLLQRVPEPRLGKNRLHLDVHVEDLVSEVARVEALGATRIDATPIEEVGSRWVRLADPEGNEFCIVEVGQ